MMKHDIFDANRIVFKKPVMSMFDEPSLTKYDRTNSFRVVFARRAFRKVFNPENVN